MISSLRGTVSHVGPSVVEIVVGGVGYEVNIATGLAAQLTAGSEAGLAIHTVVREDAISLYGFADTEERYTFRQLISVTGVGPRLALSVLSSLSTKALRSAVATNDLDALTAVPGIGKRGAQRMILELKEKMGSTSDPMTSGDPVLSEAREALTGLGYTPAEAREALEAIGSSDAQEQSVQELVKAALKELARV